MLYFDMIYIRINLHEQEGVLELDLEGQLQVGGAIVLVLRQEARAHVDLKRREQELGRRERGVASITGGLEVRKRSLGAKHLVVGLLLADGGLPLDFTAVGGVIVADKEAGVVRQRVDLAAALVQGGGGALGEVAAARARVGHEDGIAGEGRVANEVRDAVGRVAGGGDHLSLQ